MEESVAEIRDAVVSIQIGQARHLVKSALDKGLPAYRIFEEAISKGMELVGQKYESGEYFLTELLGAAEVVKELMVELGPQLKSQPPEYLGKVVIGTVRGDLHDIGKDIVAMLLSSAGFQVYDLGVDVSAESFVLKSKENEANIVAISSLLTTTMGEMKTVVQEFEKAHIREHVRVIIGGAPISESYAQDIGADAAGDDAAQGVRLCKKWMEKVTQ